MTVNSIVRLMTAKLIIQVVTEGKRTGVVVKISISVNSGLFFHNTYS